VRSAGATRRYSASGGAGCARRRCAPRAAMDSATAGISGGDKTNEESAKRDDEGRSEDCAEGDGALQAPVVTRV
jgi:hypothetical protein